MAGKFSAQVDDWVRKSESRMEGVFKQSVQDVIEDAQKPTAKGGRMRVDTGFLRNSGNASLSGMPSGAAKGSKESSYDWNEGPVLLRINALKLGQTIWFGWTANYARHRENKDAFLRMAVLKWKKYVESNTAEMKRRIR